MKYIYILIINSFFSCLIRLNLVYNMYKVTVPTCNIFNFFLVMFWYKLSDMLSNTYPKLNKLYIFSWAADEGSLQKKDAKVKSEAGNADLYQILFLYFYFY